jgi:hypothetical protein
MQVADKARRKSVNAAVSGLRPLFIGEDRLDNPPVLFERDSQTLVAGGEIVHESLSPAQATTDSWS